MFYGVDPLAEKYIGISSYAYVANNPLYFVDPDGRSMNPAYDSEDEYLGNTAGGFKGAPIVFDDKDKFKPGMSNNAAINSGGQFFDNANLSNNAKGKILTHITSYELNDGLNINEKIKVTNTGSTDYLFSAKDARKNNLDIKAGIYNEFFETTVENIRNIVNIHEVNAHVFNDISGFDNVHYLAFKMQIDSPQFLTTTERFKAWTLANTYEFYARAGKQNIFLNNRIYMDLFNKNEGYSTWNKYFKWR